MKHGDIGNCFREKAGRPRTQVLVKLESHAALVPGNRRTARDSSRRHRRQRQGRRRASVVGGFPEFLQWSRQKQGNQEATQPRSASANAWFAKADLGSVGSLMTPCQPHYISRRPSMAF